jgi:hypothetical protein
MKRIPFVVLFVFLITVFYSSCKTAPYSSDNLPENLPEKQLYFGSGGGFTGMITEYLLMDNGQLFKRPSEDIFEEMKKVKKKTAEALYLQYKEAGFDDLIFNQPGNIYYFIRMVDGENENYFSWSDQRPLPEVEMMDFYKELMGTVEPK